MLSAMQPAHESQGDRRRARPGKRERARWRSASGFTLIELLVVISIIALLIAILLPVLGSARDSAKQAQSLSNLRQVMTGYTAYHVERKGRVLYGLTPPTIHGKPVTVSAAGREFGMPVADRYPWRLAPYVDGVWELLHSHSQTPPVPTESDSDSAALNKAYQLSISPMYGLNSVYVGGHGTGPFAGFKSVNGVNVPNRGAHVVFRDTQVRRASELIVFSDSQSAGPGFEPGKGLYFVTPPRAAGHRWRAEGGRIESLMPDSIAGLPRGYYTDAAVTSFFDGHAEAMSPAALEDMRLWSNEARDENYDFR